MSPSNGSIPPGFGDNPVPFYGHSPLSQARKDLLSALLSCFLRSRHERFQFRVIDIYKLAHQVDLFRPADRAEHYSRH